MPGEGHKRREKVTTVNGKEVTRVVRDTDYTIYLKFHVKGANEGDAWAQFLKLVASKGLLGVLENDNEENKKMIRRTVR